MIYLNEELKKIGFGFITLPRKDGGSDGEQLSTAARLLKEEAYTFTAVNGENVLTSRERGVKPLLGLLDSNIYLHGFSVADKVIGKAAAFLYVLLKPDEICAAVISKPASEVLEKNHITVRYDTLTDAVRNRDNTGFCPMETAVMNADDPNEALVLIRQKNEILKRR